MKVFITGSTGFVGSCVLEQLLQAGHQVICLVRTAEAAHKAKARGAKPVLGDLESLDVIKLAAQEADATLHLAFIHDFSKYDHALKVDTALCATINNAYAGTSKPLVATSITGVCGETGSHPVKENPAQDPMRGAVEKSALKGVEQGVQTMIIRLPTFKFVYDDSYWCSFLADVQVQAAKKAQAACYIAAGDNKYLVVHKEDAASAYVAAMQFGTAGGVYHAAAEHGIMQKDVSAAVARKLSTPEATIPAKGISREEAERMYGPVFSYLFSINNDVDSSRAKQELHWKPTRSSGFLQVLAKA